jgi:hypothetical protein
MADAERTATMVNRYVARFDAVDPTGPIASGLGAWLLLALLAPAATGEARRRLEDVLGVPAAEAAARAAALVASPHPAVRAALATWASPGLAGPGWAEWAAAVPALETGPVPEQTDADRWAADRTGGLIERFPLTLGPDTAVVLASALATDVTWHVPFTEVTAHELGPGWWATRGLRAPDRHLQALVATDAAGPVAVHVADAVRGMAVVSVLAGEQVSPGAVRAAAVEVADRLDGIRAGTDRLDPFALPLGAGPAWAISEVERLVPGGGGTVVRYDTVLPAWRADVEVDILDRPGVAEACATLGSFLVEAAQPAFFEARQAAWAEYHRTGFRAAAVTAMAARAGAVFRESVRVRERQVLIRFGRPYAVAAVAGEQHADHRTPWRPESVDEPGWAGIVAFTAWVAEPACPGR